MSDYTPDPDSPEEPHIAPDETALEAAEMVDEGAPIDPATPQREDPSVEVAESVEEAKKERDQEQETSQHVAEYDDTPDWSRTAGEDTLDVEAALAALGSLNTLAEPESPVFPEDAPPTAALRQPSLTTLERGTTASVVPALLLIGVGVFLTLLVASGSPLPSPSVLTGLALAGIGLSLLAWWISTGRWARGSLFIGMLSLLAGAFVFLT